MKKLLSIFLIGFCLSKITINAETLNNDSTFLLKHKNISVLVDAFTGGRIVSFKINANEVLAGKKINPRFYGSTLWLSPEGKWRQGILDNGKYKVDRFTKNELFLSSYNDTLSGFSLTKHFTFSKDNSLIIKYTLKNISKKNQKVSPWEVTRVPTGGIALFPKVSPQSIPTPNKAYPLLSINEAGGVYWYPYDASKESAQKLFIDGGEGWVAYLRDRILFLKKFPVIGEEKYAPNEKNLELYVNKDKTYIELENQGEFTDLAPGESLSYEVKWYVRLLPENIKAETGNPAIVDYIRKF